MKYSEIAHLEKRELRQKIVKLRDDLFQARMKQKTQKLPNALVIRNLRRDIARLNTALNSSGEKDAK